jgi:hypothetical protein
MNKQEQANLIHSLHTLAEGVLLGASGIASLWILREALIMIVKG